MANKKAFDKELIIEQVEFYLSDKNLLSDMNDYLRSIIAGSEDGMICLASICSFPKMRKLLGLRKADVISEETVEDVANILRMSDFLNISKDGKKVGTKTPIAIPEEIKEGIIVEFSTEDVVQRIQRPRNQEGFETGFPKGMTITFMLKKFSENVDKKTGERAAKRRAIDAAYYVVTKEDLKVVFEKFGIIKQIVFQEAENSGHIEFEEAESSDKALATKNKEGGILVKDCIAYLERYSGFKRKFQLIPRKYIRPPNSFMQLLQIQKYRVPPSGQLFPETRVDLDMPLFGIRWCIPEWHYIVENIPVESRLPPHEACRLKLHYMSLDVGNPKSKNPNAPKVIVYQEKTTRYLNEAFNSEHPYLRDESNNVRYRNKRWNRHLKDQNVLDQQQATELMLSCHMTFQMADLLIDMRHRAPEFAARERCVCYSPPSHPGKLQMQADDLCTLIRDIMGPQFEPKIHVKEVNGELILHEVTHVVNVSMEVFHCIGQQYSGVSSDLIIF